MGIVLVNKPLTKGDIETARKDYPNYIKITIDIKKEIVFIGGEYHFDSEQKLMEEFGSKQIDIWGGGFRIKTKEFETNALINMRPFHENRSAELLDPKIRERFLQIVKQKLDNIESLV